MKNTWHILSSLPSWRTEKNIKHIIYTRKEWFWWDI